MLRIVAEYQINACYDVVDYLYSCKFDMVDVFSKKIIFV
jgi:hypothetical protein